MTDKTDSKEREALIRAITSMCHDMDNDKIVITRREGEGPALRQLLDAMQRELASFAANAGSEPVESNRPSLESVFRGLSDRAYCNYIEQMRRNECLGWEHKVKHGMFGEAELKAHTLAGRLLGRHHAFAEAANALRGSDVPLTHTSPPEGMVALPTRHELALQLLVAGGFVREEKLAQALALVDAACPALSPAQPTSSADSRKGE
ncbi:MAG: hypothetical protein HYX43_16425 [Burkholderiales bacterium]|nr:hypothetical protein [Burkholderiales bacterium]